MYFFCFEFGLLQVQSCHFSHQRGPVFVREGRSGSCGVQVAEEALDLPQGDAAAPVAHLEKEVEDKARVQFRVYSDVVSIITTLSYSRHWEALLEKS